MSMTKKPPSVKGKGQMTETNKARSAEPASPPAPKYPHPKILLLDMEPEAERVLRSEGYNVASGSFGSPYKVPKDDSFRPVIVRPDLPNFTEQEIVVIDLIPRRPLDEPQGEKHASEGENDWWASCSHGVIDPRPRAMAWVREGFDRILAHGGVFIVFSAPRENQKLVWGHREKYTGLVQEEELAFDNLCFLSRLDSRYLEMGHDLGEEIRVVRTETPLDSALSSHVKGASFLCTLQPKLNRDRWVALAENKFGTPVAVLIGPESQKNGGWIFIFPQLRDPAHFLAKLLKDVLSNISPTLFPLVEGARWVERPEYEIPKVLELKAEIHRVQESAKSEVMALEKAIEDERSQRGYLYDLLRGTGTTLVNAVKKALEVLGFSSVVDVDEEMEKSGVRGPKREDLQIHDTSPIVLVEVKGLAGLPSESATLQISKNIAPRKKEWGRTDVRGLEIINHQRHIPPLERDNEMLFQEDVLTNANDQDFGLLTTWDLSRLVRSYLRNNWSHNDIRDLFYQNGRILPVPRHYKYVGMIDQYWEKASAITVKVEVGTVRRDDRIAFELPSEFEEQTVDSLQVEKQPASVAAAGAIAGIKTHLSKEQAKKGIRVFRVEPDVSE